MGVYGIVPCIQHNQLMKSIFRKTIFFKHLFALLKEDFLLIAVGSSFSNSCHQFPIFAHLAQLMPHFRSDADKLIIDSATFLELLIQIVLLVETYIKRQCQYK